MKKAPIFIIIVCSISTLVSAQLPLNETIEFNHQNIIKWEGEEYFHDNYDYNGFEINSEKVLHFFYSQGSKRVDWGFITKIEQSEKDEIIIYTYHIK